MKQRKRDFQAEYRRRVERGIARGLSRSQARGHARAGERPTSGPVPYDRTARLEKALRLMKLGATQRQAAKSAGVTPEQLRRFMKENTNARREGGKWVIDDPRAATLLMATRGAAKRVTVPLAVTSDIGRHWSAVNKFLASNNAKHLAPFEGMGVRDAEGRFHPYETRPNMLRKLDSIGELSFIDIYGDVAK